MFIKDGVVMDDTYTFVSSSFSSDSFFDFLRLLCVCIIFGIDVLVLLWIGFTFCEDTHLNVLL